MKLGPNIKDAEALYRDRCICLPLIDFLPALREPRGKHRSRNCSNLSVQNKQVIDLLTSKLHVTWLAIVTYSVNYMSCDWLLWRILTVVKFIESMVQRKQFLCTMYMILICVICNYNSFHSMFYFSTQTLLYDNCILSHI